MERTRQIMRYVALGLLALLAVYSFVRFGRYRGLGAHVLQPGTLVEPFRLSGLGGEAFELGKAGRPALLVFWASHCPSCKVELPVLQRVAAAYKGRIDVVTIADDEPEALALAASKLKLSLPVLLDTQGQVSRQFDVFTIPYNVLVGADRKIVTDFVGPADETRIRAWFEALLGEDGARGAHVDAGAAVGALVGVDGVDGVALGDRLNGAFGRAASAGRAVVGDPVSHGVLPVTDGSVRVRWAVL